MTFWGGSGSGSATLTPSIKDYLYEVVQTSGSDQKTDGSVTWCILFFLPENYLWHIMQENCRFFQVVDDYPPTIDRILLFEAAAFLRIFLFIIIFLNLGYNRIIYCIMKL
jgi:hypothetical protein